MKKKHALTACFVILILWAINSVAFGEIVNGVETDEAPPPSGKIKPSKGIRPIPEASTLINFDNVSAPCVFSSTVALRNEYAAQGVVFRGTPVDSNNGGAILNECSNFGVTGHSSPNFLAFNADAPMEDGGIPKIPELIIFINPVSSVQINAGVGFGVSGKVVMIAKDPNFNTVGFDVINVASQMQTLIVRANAIKFVIIAGQLSTPWLVLDDLAFTSVKAAPQKQQIKKLTTTWGALKSKS